MLAESEATISVWPDTIWQHLVDPNLIVRWMHDFDEIYADDGRPMHLESKLSIKSGENRITGKISAYKPTHKIGWQTTDGSTLTTYKFGIYGPYAHANETIVTLEMTKSGGAVENIAAGLIRWQLRRQCRQILGALKQEALATEIAWGGTPPEMSAA
jgi:uncharacterized protein YndB with AHSA1/START domain